MANRTPTFPETAAGQPTFDNNKKLLEGQIAQPSLVLCRNYPIADDDFNSTYNGSMIGSVSPSTQIKDVLIASRLERNARDVMTAALSQRRK